VEVGIATAMEKSAGTERVPAMTIPAVKPRPGQKRWNPNAPNTEEEP